MLVIFNLHITQVSVFLISVVLDFICMSLSHDAAAISWHIRELRFVDHRVSISLRVSRDHRYHTLTSVLMLKFRERLSITLLFIQGLQFLEV